LLAARRGRLRVTAEEPVHAPLRCCHGCTPGSLCRVRVVDQPAQSAAWRRQGTNMRSDSTTSYPCG
jgi:hypothetical protein